MRELHRTVRPGESVSEDEAAGGDRITVGVWDLGSWVGFLDKVLEQWNSVQDRFLFQVVLSSVPFQLTQGGQRTEDIASAYLSKATLKEDRKDLHDNIFINNIWQIADNIRTQLKYDQLVSITPYMLAYEENKKFHYNYFSLSENGVIFVSTKEMRDFAARAKRPFEAAIASIVLGQILVDRSPQLEYHDHTAGCLFDFNEERHTISSSFKKLMIEPACFDRIADDLRPAAETMLTTLREYKRASPD